MSGAACYTGNETVNISTDERFWRKVDRSGDCWIWTAGTYTQGYGSFAIGYTSIQAHRFAWTHLRGPIPEGLTLDHLCRTKRCVNPSHLEIVTHAENSRRYQAWKNGDIADYAEAVRRAA